jgi:hypothetical protein
MASIIRHIDGVRVTEIGKGGEVVFFIKHGRIFTNGNHMPVEMSAKDVRYLMEQLEEMLKEGGW